MSLILCLITFFVPAQEMQFSEPVNKEYTRFFYDDNYYLVDKYCEFKAIERVAQFDTITQKFSGEFKDFNLKGKLILHGFYKDGLKHGNFTAYHPNGQIKWESTFVDNAEIGLWKYYYPDGKPMLIISLEDNDFKFLHFWNTLGEHKIQNGVGIYDINLPLIGFTDHGYTTYNTQGAILNGKPSGTWTTSFNLEGKKKKLLPVLTETFSQGQRTAMVLNPDLQSYYIPLEDFHIVPSDIFARAEFFIPHNCTFDQYSGFHHFITRIFNHHLRTIRFENLSKTLQYKVQYTINSKGTPLQIETLNYPDDVPNYVQENIISIFSKIQYFIPSISQGVPIDDKVTLISDFLIRDGKATLGSLKILRENGE
ncbi:toxin-antitoxin system YwqK family antitoxin [Sphingobacterium sp. SGL-16]|uniref:toxin-antitoxin system YwqK family antitoxin n=1 Tax=Sphingobacterium sp. SGL-16 TaxID=2710883 RepID=UPI0019CF6A0A|nr:hypothetical protein [Sphingobacterium sp. SGL-16]